MSTELEKILENIPDPVEGERVCAICLMPILREEYDAHMQDIHGYETLNINLKCKCKLPTKGEYLGNQDAYRCIKCGGYVSGLEVQRRRRDEFAAKNPSKKAIDG